MKPLIIIISILVISGLGVFGYLKMNEKITVEKEDQSDEKKANAVTKKDPKAGDHREEIEGTVTQEELEQYKEEGKNPFGESIQGKQLRDSDVQEYIHGMTHQKVIAEKKWGFYEIHPTRIEWLLKAVNESSDRLISSDVYKEILTKWQEGNFAEVDQDHNTIWNIQGGTVGKATGIMSKDDEAEYVNKQ